MNLKTVLSLGRVSNLPTIWTNVLAGVALSGAMPSLYTFPTLIISISLFYTGGMFLNDAFDAKYDAKHQPFRPIPSGKAKREAVFFIGCIMLVSGLALLLTAAHFAHVSIAPALLSGLALLTCIVLYDKSHKEKVYAPFIMGICRGLIYISVVLACSGTVNIWAIFAAFLLFGYVAGVSFMAKRETPAFIVAFLIAGICLIDAVIIGATYNPAASTIGIAMFGLTLFWHKFIRGT